MIRTFILALCFILAILLMLYAAVALVQDKSLFGSAPKDIVDAIQPREERFKGARFLGWSLIILSMLILVAVAVIGIWDGVTQGFGFSGAAYLSCTSTRPSILSFWTGCCYRRPASSSTIIRKPKAAPATIPTASTRRARLPRFSFSLSSPR